MNRQKMFEIWKGRREHIEVSPGFSERVMEHLKERPAPRQPAAAAGSASWFRWLVARPWTKAAVVVMGVLAGFVRIVMTLDLLLRA
jgi:hypothetical protein